MPSFAERACVWVWGEWGEVSRAAWLRWELDKGCGCSYPQHAWDPHLQRQSCIPASVSFQGHKAMLGGSMEKPGGLFPPRICNPAGPSPV